MSALLVLSLLANVLLLAVLFFRPDLAARLRGRPGTDAVGPPPHLARCAEALDAFATHYFLWLISARIMMWTSEPEELKHAEEMMEAGRAGLRRATESLDEWRLKAPPPASDLIDELLRTGAMDGVTPTAAVFHHKAEGVRLLVARAKAALKA